MGINQGVKILTPKRWQLLLLSILIIFGMAIYILPIPQSKIGNIAINIGFTGTAQAGILEFDIVIPTGSTNADTYVQDALDRLPAEGGQLKLWDISITTNGIWIHHDYIWQDATTVTRAIGNVTIIGMGASTIINSDGVTPVFKAGGNGWLIKNINFGNNTNAVDKNGFNCMVCECWVNGVWVNDCDTVGNITVAPGNITLADGHILVGNATGQAMDVAMTGDVSIDNTGLTNLMNVDDEPVDGATTDPISSNWAFDLGNTTREPTGFPNLTDTSAPTFASPTITLAKTGATFDFYIKGVKYTKNANQTVALPNGDATDIGTWYIYFNTAGTLTATKTTSWDIATATECSVAVLYFNGSAGRISDERHGTVMDAATHDYLHYTVGTRYVSGLTGTFTAPANISIALGVISDEDLEYSFGIQTQCVPFYHVSGYYSFVPAQNSYVVQDGGGLLQYDNLTDLVEVTNNKYVAYWIFATMDTIRPIWAMPGQREDTTLASAEANNKYESLSLGTLPFPEMKLLYRVIVQRSGTSEVYVETQDLRTVSNLPAGTYVATDHGSLTGLLDDDHTQYILVGGTRDFTGNQSHGDYSITNVGDIAVDSLTADNGSLIDLNNNVDFNTYKAIAMVCDNGTTLPTSPVAGQWFLHTPTGRKILYQYDGSTWIPIISLGAMTVYVDTTNGTDSQSKGTSTTTSAYKTIQYAVDQIPPLYSGTVAIYASAGNYTETVTFKGKAPTGNYEIFLYGAYAAATDTGTCAAGSVQGTGATQATVVDNTGGWGVNDYENKLVIFGAATTTVALRYTFAVIDSNTANTLTLVGCLPAAPAAGDTFAIYDYGTIVNRITTQVGQIGINVFRMNIVGDGSNSLYLYPYSRMVLTRCKVTDARIYVQNYAAVTFVSCYLLRSSSSYLLQAVGQCLITFTKSKIDVTHDTGSAAQLEAATYCTFTQGSIIDGYVDGSHNASAGIYVLSNSVLSCYSSAANGYSRLRNLDLALDVTTGSQISLTANNQYSGNTVDENWILGGDEQYLRIKEQAGAPTAVATYGYLYVDNGTPNDLWWEDDAGNTEQLSAASACFLFLWDKTTRRIAAVQTYASWDTVPVVTGGFITVLKKQWDLTKYEYKLYPPQSYAPPYQTAITSYTEDGEPIIEQRVVWNSITIDSLGLRDFTPAELAKATYDPAKEIATLQSQVIILNTAKEQSQTTIESLLKLITELEYRIKVLEDKLGVKP